MSGLTSKTEFESLTQISLRGLKSKSWSLLKLWILFKVLSLNGRGLNQCSSRHFLGYYWILAQIHEVGSRRRLLFQIHIQSRAPTSLKPMVWSASFHVSICSQRCLTGTKGSSNSLRMLQTLEQMSLFPEQAGKEQTFRMPDKVCSTWRWKMGNISDRACVGVFSVISQSLFILGGLDNAIYKPIESNFYF